MEQEKNRINRISLIIALIFIFIHLIVLFSGFFGNYWLIHFHNDLVCSPLDANVKTTYSRIGQGATGGVFNFSTIKHPLCPVINTLMFLISPGWLIPLYFFTYAISFILYFLIAKGILTLKYKLSRRHYAIISVTAILILFFLIITFCNYNPCWSLSGQDKQDCLNAFAYATVFNEKYYCLQKTGELTYCKGTEIIPIDEPKICLQKYDSSFEQRRCFMQIASDCDCWLRSEKRRIAPGGIDPENHDCCDNLKEVSPFNLIIE